MCAYVPKAKSMTPKLAKQIYSTEKEQNNMVESTGGTHILERNFERPPVATMVFKSHNVVLNPDSAIPT